jgi:hypothetical protein
MLHVIPHRIDSLSSSIAKKTRPFVETLPGKIFLSFVLLGPLTFIPTIHQAWTAENIDALRTWTWPLMILINLSALLGLIHNGDWRMRFVMVIWIVTMAAVWLATLVR